MAEFYTTLQKDQSHPAETACRLYVSGLCPVSEYDGRTEYQSRHGKTSGGRKSKILYQPFPFRGDGKTLPRTTFRRAETACGNGADDCF